ncbi:hypothetical protein PPERSA_04276 [Pseudocohnilembus persalinus]|uniref:Potassium channel domain-containing protein n=1 Tax=Pseudocohnilembus persalinus TaxID=266149 RepID=A0A0V0QP04_PSEPJ|nr:hypothetical protein PPERSA_04276 [Pseudocohnilembus persalinus]|eukprot:KRX03768.1 hypothetical protein PPERSA_04276 [Pseudocohnilembus persalinus]
MSNNLKKQEISLLKQNDKLIQESTKNTKNLDSKRKRQIYPSEFWNKSNSKGQFSQRQQLNEDQIDTDRKYTTLQTETDNLFSEPSQRHYNEGKIRMEMKKEAGLEANEFLQQTESKSKKSNIIKEFGQDNNSSAMENGRVTKFYFDRIMNFEYTILFFAFITVVFSIVYYDNDYMEYVGDPNELADASKITDFCLWTIFISMIFQDIVIDTFVFIDESDLKFKLNWLLALLSLLRILIILRVILRNTIFLSPRAHRLTRMYGCQANYQFAIKCLFQDHPLLLITVVFFLSVVVFAFALRICERPINMTIDPSEVNKMNFQSLENSIWCIIITITSVGYGDYFPKTIFGRLLDIIIAIWGLFIVSMMVVVLTNTLEMDSSEKRALNVIQRLETRKDLREKAAKLLTGIATYNFLERKRKKNGTLQLTVKYLRNKAINIKKYTDEFRTVNRKMKNLYDKDNLYEEFTRQFDFVRDDIRNLSDSQDKLCQYLQENFNLGVKKKNINNIL